MGLRFRKSKNFGPFRVSLSKSGLSSSVGVKGFRVTRTARGRTRTTASLPGTGISYVKDTGGSSSGNSSQILKHAVRGYVLGVVFVVLFLIILAVFAASHRNTAAKSTTIELPTATPQEVAETPAPRVMIAEEPAAEESANPGGEEKQEFILNTNTKKFHRPACASVAKISDKNKKELETTREDLIRQGYDPCDICRP